MRLYSLLRDRLYRPLWRYTGPRLGQLMQHPPRPLHHRPPPTTAPAEAPRISVVIPVLNAAPFIAASLNSLIHQSYPNLEIIVQDGGSTDNTIDILQKYSKQITHLNSSPDHGQSHALNLGFAQATGDILAYLNADDLLLPGTLALVAQHFANHSATDVIYGHRVLIDTAGQEIGRWILPPHNNHALYYADYIPQETLFWRRRIWERVGGCFDEGLHYTMDWDLLLRFVGANAQFQRLPYFMGAFRVHGGQKTGHTNSLTEMAAIRQRYLGRHVTRLEIHAALVPYMLRHRWDDLRYRLIEQR